ncbi:hypothetical protein OESDEN_13658 [Oesophagostomum dentatum]|uniref:Phosphorylase b kinase regulatory subunit n=1 Tax=Oesophagostomum dentatum TaxID=61180 RepID=A0A0B1STR7_OESDE|nr:hypothetical protein OESDEN_13658 [Oesophagostomum dentatum]
MDSRRSHLMYDIRILMDEWSSELQYIYASWNSVSISGRPLVVLVVSSDMLTTFMDSRRSHLMYDIRILMDEWSSELQYIYASWNSVSISGRPLVVLVVSSDMLTTDGLSDFSNISLNRFMKSTVMGTIKKINTGYLGGARIVMKNLSDFFRTTAVSKLEFTDETEMRDLLLGEPETKIQFALPSDVSIGEKPSPSPAGRRVENGNHSRNMLKTYSRNTNLDSNNSSRRDVTRSQMTAMKPDDLSCEGRMWALVRLTAGLLDKRLEELGKAVTHLLVRQKQITVGMPSKKEEAITSPKTNEELKEIMHRAYSDDPNAFMLSQVLASELARIRNLSAADAAENLMTISPFELKSMLFSLLSGRLLEEFVDDGEAAKETRTGIGSFRRHIEERKSLWDTVNRLPHGIKINDTILHWGLTQEMTRREMKFALEVEQALNRIAEPEYREMVVEALWLLGRLDKVVQSEEPNIPRDRPLDVDALLRKANEIFVQHNVSNTSDLLFS